MTTIELSAASLALVLHDLEHASDNDQSVSLTLDGGLKIKVGDDPWSPPHGTVQQTSGPTLYPYLDLSAMLLPAHELDTLDSAPPEVIRHEFGAWIQVMDAEDWPDDDPDSTEPPEFPHLRAVLDAARQLGAQWINLDSQGLDVLGNLPQFEH